MSEYFAGQASATSAYGNVAIPVAPPVSEALNETAKLLSTALDTLERVTGAIEGFSPKAVQSEGDSGPQPTIRSLSNLNRDKASQVVSGLARLQALL